jgi:hypothetical protein
MELPAIQVKPRRRRRARVAAAGRVRHIQLNQAHIDAHGRCRHLPERGVRPLAHIGPGVAQHHPLNLDRAVHFNDGFAIFRRTKREADVFERAGNAPPLAQRLWVGGQD